MNPNHLATQISTLKLRQETLLRALKEHQKIMDDRQREIDDNQRQIVRLIEQLRQEGLNQKERIF